MKPATASEAAEELAQICFCAGGMCSGCEANTKKIFLKGVAWARANDPEVLALVEALDGADSILVCAGFPRADLMDIILTAQKRISEALAAFAKRAGK